MERLSSSSDQSVKTTVHVLEVINKQRQLCYIRICPDGKRSNGRYADSFGWMKRNGRGYFR